MKNNTKISTSDRLLKYGALRYSEALLTIKLGYLFGGNAERAITHKLKEKPLMTARRETFFIEN